MSKKLLFKVLVALCFVAVAVIWLLSAAGVIVVNLSWVIAIFAFALAFLFIVYGFAAKTVGVAKKLYILFGGVLVVAGVLALVGAFVIEAKLVLPIIAIVITAVVLLCILAVGGKKWDQADNENVGYKDYRTRKREEEERRKREEEENNK